MRWKIAIALSFAWLTLGIIGLRVEVSESSPLWWVVIGPASIEYAVCHCVDRVFVDAAHSPPFLTIPGIVLVYLLPGVLLIWLALSKLRPRGYVVVGVLPLLLIGAAVFPWVREPATPAAGSVQHGDYLLEPPRPCRPRRPSNTQRIFFKGRVLTRAAGEIVFSPLNPSRVLYQAEPWCTDEAVATFYFDATRDVPVRVFGELRGAQLFWSPDDNFVVLSNYTLALVNLQTGQSTDLSDFFVGKGVDSSHPQFRGWSPDGKKLDLANVATYRREDGSVFSVSDLVSLDLATLTGTYTGTIAEPGGELYRKPERERTTDLGGGVTLVETVRGFPGESQEVVVHQAVLHRGSIVWESRHKTYDISLSPDHRYLVAWNNLNRLEPWRVDDLSSGKSVAIQKPDEPVRLPLKFGRWADDSRSILAATDAYEFERDAEGRQKPDSRLVPYRQTFLIDPSNGTVRKDKRCQSPEANWDGTPCAGAYRE